MTTHPANPVQPGGARTQALLRPLNDAHTALNAATAAIRASKKAINAVQAAHRRAEIAEAELEALRGGVREWGADPTNLQNMYAQLASRTRQWKDAQARLDRLKQMADAWEQQLPGTIRTATAVDAIRIVLAAEEVR